MNTIDNSVDSGTNRSTHSTTISCVQTDLGRESIDNFSLGSIEAATNFDMSFRNITSSEILECRSPMLSETFDEKSL